MSFDFVLMNKRLVVLMNKRLVDVFLGWLEYTSKGVALPTVIARLLSLSLGHERRSS